MRKEDFTTDMFILPFVLIGLFMGMAYSGSHDAWEYFAVVPVCFVTLAGFNALIRIIKEKRSKSK